MRYSQLTKKEIVNIDNGEKLGELDQLDMLIDAGTGKILELIFPHGQHISVSKRNYKYIQWNNIRTFGEDMVLISLQANNKDDL